ncbi:TAP-like protein-domain-containing protein [Chaetomium tenue]|uniref:TAP-like protein-domain-containing protein n=1 Tax=Chaetomium tenue TaxID=1854479 RepID=A0ACB7NWA3_9PEZI|nr:TAP-like protein-domain-containing protein [Chaetomium globosum]
MEEKTSAGAWPQPATRTEAPRRHGSTKWRFPFGGLLVSLVALGYLTNLRHVRHETQTPLTAPKNAPDNPMDPWSSIPPSTNLTFHPCYTAHNPTFLCARLTVPMDYSRPLPPTTSPTLDNPPIPQVHIALLLLPAARPPPPGSKPKSPVLVNPGGPGGSGVAMTLLAGEALQDVLGYDQPVLGFDPRGVMFTTPGADCWAKPLGEECKSKARSGNGGGGWDDGECDEEGAAAAGLMHRLQWQQVGSAYGLVSGGGQAMQNWEVAQRGVSGLCGEKDRRLGGDSGLGWAGTREVVRDMVTIVDKWDEWVEREGLPERELKGKLVYWGFSYGSYLGAAFARAFPERVGRVVLDGVVDAELYEEPVWEESLVDADRVFGEFFRYCAEAGSKCFLYRDGDRKEDVQRRYEATMEGLRTNPIIFTHPNFFYPAVFRHEVVKRLVFTSLYSPIQGFSVVAWLVNYIYEGNYKSLGSLFQDEKLLCSIGANPMLMRMMNDAQRAIMCGDKLQPTNYTLGEWKSAYKSMASTSQFADIWIPLMMQCSGWDLTSPQQTPSSPWKSVKQIDTANPILFLSNTYDPVTPLRAAVKMALKFKGAGLLEQEAPGHCTISAASRCTANVVREYLATGKVPPPPKGVDDQYRGEWKHCSADEYPWGPSTRDMLSAMSTEEGKMAEGWGKMRWALEKIRNKIEQRKGLNEELIMAMANHASKV